MAVTSFKCLLDLLDRFRTHTYHTQVFVPLTIFLSVLKHLNLFLLTCVGGTACCMTSFLVKVAGLVTVIKVMCLLFV